MRLLETTPEASPPSHNYTVCDACAAQAGSPCCPSNKDSPHTSIEDKLSRKPFCTDGSVCFYFAPVPGFNNGDTYAANKGVLTGQHDTGCEFAPSKLTPCVI